MRAALYTAFQQPLHLTTVPDPPVPDDGVVIAVRAVGICRSDWHGWMGHDADIRLPHVPGHELAGVVAACGPRVRRWQPGDRVTVPFACGCGSCDQCLAGQQHICDHYFQPGFTAWGAFAEYVAIPHADVNLVRLPDDLDFVAAASLGCRFVTAYRAVVAQGRAAPGEWVAVFGCGGVGLSAVMIAAALGAQVVAVDIQTAALTLAQHMGAQATVSVRHTPSVVEAVRAITGGGAHLTLDALGSHATCRHGILSLRKRGRHVQVGLMAAEAAEPPLPMSAVIARELEIIGSHGMPAHAYRPMLELIAAGRLKPHQLVQQRLTLAEGMAFLPHMNQFTQAGVTVIDRF